MKAEAQLSYRKPWIMVDGIDQLQAPARIVTRKHISSSDFYLQGHFPAYSIYPGMLMVEGLCQSAELLLSEGQGLSTLRDWSVLKARFLSRVMPGDTVTYTVSVVHRMQDRIVLRGIGDVSGVKVIQAELVAAEGGGTLNEGAICGAGG